MNCNKLEGCRFGIVQRVCTKGLYILIVECLGVVYLGSFMLQSSTNNYQDIVEISLVNVQVVHKGW